MSDDQETSEISLVVGVGASAGGLSALKQLFDDLPERSGLVFLVVQHLDPNHSSMMAEILDKRCRLKVTEARDGHRLEADCVYTIPPDAYIEISDRAIRVVEPTEKRGFRTAVDHLFRSLAKSYGTRAVGIVLSGAGSDGTAGLRAIKAEGGLVLVQNPESAEYQSMPRSAIGTGIVDRVMEAKDMAGFIHHYSGQPYVEDGLQDELADSFITKVGDLLSDHEGFDLGPYKDTTVGRRLCRRISLSGVAKAEDYLALMREDEGERKALMKDLLINVTDFFRDRKAFDSLKQIVPTILDSVRDGGDVRIWVAGCATGEEAYSLAILFWESIEQSDKDLDLKIFATDVDEEAIAFARKGVYPTSALEVLPPDLRKKYFREDRAEMLKVVSYLRDKISFATQNLFADPPFSRMDLISCRNVLIYLRPETQVRILNSLGFALRPEGYLFLGSSESLGEQTKLFRQISARWRIFQRRAEVKDSFHTPLVGRKSTRQPGEPKPRNREKSKPTKTPGAQEVLLQQLEPAVVIDGENRILFVHGSLDGFLRIPEGEPNLDLISTLHPELGSRIRGAAFKARRSGEEVVIHPPRTFVKQMPEKGNLVVRVVPVEHPSLGEGVLVVRFTTSGPVPEQNDIPSYSKEHDCMVDDLERELAQTRDELVNATQELELSNEELKASQEEALSTNEELQSANEELEASTEELRSLNEELTTVNSHLKEKIEQLQSANDYRKNLFASSNIATLFLNGKLELSMLTPAAERLLDLGPQDIGRRLHGISHELMGGREARDIEAVMESLESSQRDIQTSDGRWFTRKILPFKTADQRIDGVVITYFETTELKNAIRLLEASEQRHSLLAKLSVDALGGRSVDALQHEIVREVAHVLDSDFSKVLRYEPERKRLHLVAGIGWEKGIIGEAYVSDEKHSQAGYTLMDRDPVIVSDLQKERRFHGPDLLLDHGVVSGISCVIEGGEHPYGVLAVHSRSPRAYTHEEATFLSSVANLLSVAVTREMAEKEVAQGRDRLDMAREAAQIGIHDHDLTTDTVSWDTVIRKIWGVPDDLDPVTFEIFRKGLHPDDCDKTLTAIEEAAKDEGRKYLRIEYRVVNALTKRVHWVEATGTTAYESGKAVRIVGTVQDITERKEILLTLAAKEEKLRMARDSNRLGAFELSHADADLDWDPLLAEIWGLEENETPTMKIFWEGLHPDDREATATALKIAGDPESDGHYHAIYRVINRKDGRETWVEASGQNVFNNGKPERMIGMVIDITEQKNLEASLQNAVEELEASNEAKNRFLATLGHELRNPLMAVSMGISVLERDPAKLDKLLDLLRANTNLISSLLDDLLDLTRISQGKMKLAMDQLDLGSLVGDHVEGFRAKAAEKELTVRFGKTVDPVWVEGDSNRLGQVIGNLLTNAYKFSEAGGEISVSLRSDEESARLTVTDTGIGIANEDLDKIFDPFEQLHGSQQGNTGLGIGLSLVRELVEKHGGSVRASSDGEGQGASFTIELPKLREYREENGAEEEEHVNLRPGLRILVVDDNRDAATGLVSILRGEGCEVVQCDSAPDALKARETFEPEIMLIDIGLGETDGCDLLKEIVSRHDDRAVAIAVTGFGHEEARQKTAAAGFHHHINKPPDIERLLRLMATCSE